MKILMTTDGSAAAATALQTGARLLKPQSRFDLLCVAPTFKRGAQHSPGARLREAYERKMLQETLSILEQGRDLLQRSGIHACPISELGPPAETILQKAAEYDLVAIGAKGRDVRFDVGLGPVVSRVLEHSSTPVMIGRQLISDRGFSALIPVDGSAASLRAIEVATEAFEFAIGEITLLHVVETPWIHLGLEDNFLDEYETEEVRDQPGMSFELELTREGSAIIENARDALGATHAGVETIVERGNPADEILSAAERGQHDVIIMGATGVTDLKHRLLGSVSTKVAWNASCSVAVVSAPE